MQINEAINYYRLDPEITMKTAKRFGFEGDLNAYQIQILGNSTLHQMQDKLAMKIAKEMGIRPSKVMRALQIIGIFHEEQIDYDEIGEMI